MRINQVAWGGAVSAGLLLSVPGRVTAQQFASAVLEEIVVTARRREENLLNLPLSIATISAGEMQARGIYTIDDATEFVPNLDLSEARANANLIVIRGIGGQARDLSRVIGSGMYVDGHYISDTVGGYMSTLDIERIEVLRGPQGTLYGKNVMGGAVNIISTRPQADFDSSVSLRLAEDGDANLRGMINVPFSDTVYGRFSYAAEEFDGYYYNRFLDRYAGGEDTRTLNAAIRFQPTDDWTIDASINLSEQRDDTGGQCFGDPNGDAPQWGGGPGQIERRLYTGARADLLAMCAEDVASGDFVNSSEKLTFSNADAESAFLKIQYAVNDTLDLSLNASVRNMENWFLHDRDYMAWPLDSIGTADASAKRSSDTESFELLLEGAPNERLQFTAGVHYFEETGHAGGNDNCYQRVVALTDPAEVTECDAAGVHFEVVPDNPDGSGFWPDGPRSNPNGPAPFFTNVSAYNQSLGVFGHITYALDDAWKLDFGVRWTEDERRFNNIEFPSTGCDAGLDPTSMCTFTLPVSQEFVSEEGFFNTAADTFDEVTPMISLTRSLAPRGRLDSGIVYLLYSEGYLTGGFNTELNSNLPAVAPFLSFQPEHVHNYEVGFKGAFADGRFRIMADIFYMDYTDQQLPVELENPNFEFGADDRIGIVQNVASSHLYGLELEMRAIPWDGAFLTLDAGTLRHSSYDKYLFVDPGSGAVSDFTNLPNDPLGPEWTVAVALEHTFLFGGGSLTPRLGVYWQDEYEWESTQPGSVCFQDVYARVDARVSYTPADGDWQLALYGQNINDERALDLCGTRRDAYQGRYIRPAHWGIEFSANFGRF